MSWVGDASKAIAYSSVIFVLVVLSFVASAEAPATAPQLQPPIENSDKIRNKIKGWWMEMDVQAICLTDDVPDKKLLDFYPEGKTFYGSSAYAVGIIADRHLYPKGTRFYIKELKKWLTVDDYSGEVTGEREKIIIRFLGGKSKSEFKTGKQRVFCSPPTSRKELRKDANSE